MEMPSSNYLYTLAVVATTFAGFAALIIVFRQTLGGKITRLDAFVMRSFVQLGFMATAGSMLPPLLALYALAPRVLWSSASLAIGCWLAAWALSFRHRRNAVSKVPAPAPVYVVIGIFDITALVLILNAAFAPVDAVAAIYASAITLILAGGATFFLFSLIYLVDHPIEHVHPRPERAE